MNSNPLKSRSFNVSLGRAASESPSKLLDLKRLLCDSSGPILILWKEMPSVMPESEAGLGANGWKDEKERDCLAGLSLSSFSDGVKASLVISLFFAESKKSFSSPKILDRQHTETTSCREMIYVISGDL